MSNDEAKQCPCGLSAAYEACCGRYISGVEHAPTPEALMRSRYTAFSRSDIGYIQQTMRDEALAQFDEADNKQWADSVQWLRLEVVDAPHVSEGDAKGVVEFKAYYRLNGVAKCVHERSCFKLIDSRWYYTGSESFRLNDSASIKQPKIGRNEPCPCGSGKKYKKCCQRKSTS